MAIPQNITDENIIQALKYIDQHGIPEKNKSTKYELITEDGKKYPPKYVIAIADHLINNTDISTDNFVSVEAINFLIKKGFNVNMKEFELIITKNDFQSNDPTFDINNILKGDKYKAKGAYFQDINGTKIERQHIKHEQGISGQTLPKIAFQVFEDNITGLSDKEKRDFPITKYPKSDYERGIFNSEEELKKARNSASNRFMSFQRKNGEKYVILCNNIFSTLLFVQECLKRFGKDGDKFVLEYSEKEKDDKKSISNSVSEINDVENKTIDTNNSISVNTILYGPPGTGKTYNTVIYAVAICNPNNPDKTLEKLKKQAKNKSGYDAICEEYTKLVAEDRIAFTTFHQSYGYEDFIEGIKPIVDENDSNQDITYDVKPGIFKKFCENDTTAIFDKVWNALLDKALVEEKKYEFKRRTGSSLATELRDNNSFIVKWKSGSYNTLKKEQIYYQWLTNAYDKRDDFTGGTKWSIEARQAIIDEMISKFNLPERANHTNNEPRVLIIDEINRGNVSKIFGELITLIEEEKRGKSKVKLPYSQSEFTVPENVYILGTMNTADRSLALMDTALRRRFDFVEMMPDASIFEGIEVDGVSIESLLKKINKRIEFLYDREHTIGHAYFKELLDKENRNIETLRKIFIKKIIPLLQEYFYDDYERIRLVLGDNRTDLNGECFIQECADMDKLFFGNEEIDRESKIYSVNEDIKKFNAERFRKIYE